VAILAVLTEEELAIERIGLEAGPLSQWLIFAAGDRTAWLTMQSGANQSQHLTGKNTGKTENLGSK
jgi:hypothetical protein